MPVHSLYRCQLIVDGKSHDLPLVTATEGNDGFDVSSLLKDTGLVTLDPGFVNTASCESAITYIDGDEGILRYRGYPIEQLAEKSTFVEVAYLLIYGELPTPAELDDFDERVRRHTLLHEDLRRFFGASRATRTRCRCCRRRSPRCPPSTRTASTRSTRSRSSSPPSACWPRCRRSRRTRTRASRASRSSTRTTRAATSRTSCG